jgi:hypothetical protein
VKQYLGARVMVMLEFDDVPDDAVAFGVNAPCPECAGAKVQWIDRRIDVFACSSEREHRIPAKTIEVEGRALVVVNKATNTQEVFEGRFHSFA